MQINVEIYHSGMTSKSLFYEQESLIFDKSSAMKAFETGDYNKIGDAVLQDIDQTKIDEKTIQELLKHIVKKTQFNKKNNANRSTCVGDIFVVDKDIYIFGPTQFDRLSK